VQYDLAERCGCHGCEVRDLSEASADGSDHSSCGKAPLGGNARGSTCGCRMVYDAEAYAASSQG